MGSAGHCEPEAVAPEIPSPCGELVPAGAGCVGSADPRALLAFCAAFRLSAASLAVSGLRLIALILPPVYWFAWKRSVSAIGPA